MLQPEKSIVIVNMPIQETSDASRRGKILVIPYNPDDPTANRIDVNLSPLSRQFLYRGTCRK